MRNEFHNALLAATITNMSGKVLPSGHAANGADFMPLSMPKGDQTIARLRESLTKMGATMKRVR